MIAAVLELVLWPALAVSALTGAAMTEPEPGGRRPWEPPGLYVTVYDWGLGGINCDHDCSTTALTTTGDELLGHVAACPSAWLGRITTTVVTVWGQQYWCADAFGRPEHRVLTEVDGRPVYRIDIAFRPAAAHPWNQERVPAGDWSREWRPMAEFEALRREWAAALGDKP